jgi:hypothetical protein
MIGIKSVRAVSLFAVALVLSGMFPAPSARAEIWGVKSKNISNLPATLFSLDDNGEALTVIGPVKLDVTEIDVDALALSPAGVLYGFEVAGGAWSRLITIDTVTAKASVVGPQLAATDMRGAMFTADGRLLAIDITNDSLVRIDPSTGSIIGTPMPLMIGGHALDADGVDLAQRMDGSTVMVESSLTASGGSDFYSLDIDTGELVLLHTDLINAPEGVSVGILGIATSPYGDNPERLVAYDVVYEEDIFHYDPTNSWARTNGPLDIIPSYNAGRGDLAGPVIPEPMTLGLLGLGGLALLRRRRAASPGAVRTGASRTAVLLIVAGLVTGLLAASAHAEIYGAKSNVWVSDPPTTLFSLDDNGEVLTEIGRIKVDVTDIDVDALALSPAGVLYGFEVADGAWSRLITINTTNAKASVVGPQLAATDMRGAMFTADGRLLVIDAADDSLVEIDPASGNPIGTALPLTVGGTPYSSDREEVDLAQRMDGSTVMVQGAPTGNTFYELDIDTGALVLLHTDPVIAPDGYPVDFAGLATSPDGDNPERLIGYDVAWEEDIVHYDPTDSWARSYGPLDIIPSYNAGRGDLAGPVIPEPATLGLLGLGALALLRRRKRG